MSEAKARQAPYMNPFVAALPRYNAGMGLAAARAASGLEQIACLASNENPHGCSPAVQRVLSDGSVQVWRYSDPACTQLRAALAEKLGVDAARIVIGNGSEEMIAAISRAFLSPAAVALTVTPSFGLHEIEPLAMGARVIKVPMTADLQFDVPALEAALAQAPNLLFLPTPSNPVGSALDAAALQRIIDAAPASTLLVLDEAYFEFISAAIPDGLEMLLRTQRPYVVLRTFSKAYGLAGLRVGYAVCSSAEIASMLSVAKTPFNVNAVAQAAAVAALGDEAWMRDAVAKICSERERVTNALRAMGLTVVSSEGNFVFFDAGRDSKAVAADLLRQGVVIKPWLEPGYQQFIRASIGSVAENDQFLAAMAAVINA